MRFSPALFLSIVALVVSVSGVPLSEPLRRPRDVPTNLVPDLGFISGINPTGTGDCDGAVNGSDGKPIKIPCSCPPSRDAFIAALNANVGAGHVLHNPSVAITFPTINSVADQEARIEACIVTLQNLNGPGQGCPVVSTTLGLQQQSLQSKGTTLAAISVAPATSAAASTNKAASATTPAAVAAKATPITVTSVSSPASTAVSNSVIAALAPSLGFPSGVNPTGTGDCDGAVNGSNGKPIKVPCSCPPAQSAYIQALEANVAAGHAIHNTGVKVTFPTGNSNSDKAARVEAAIITLQNFNGPGQGCPVASTTLGEQQNALQ